MSAELHYFAHAKPGALLCHGASEADYLAHALKPREKAFIPGKARDAGDGLIEVDYMTSGEGSRTVTLRRKG